MSEYTVVTQSYVSLTVISETKEFGVEKRFSKDLQILDLKNKLEMITGYLTADMKLRLLNKDKKLLCEIDDDSKMLGFYPCEDGYLLEVIANKTVLGVPFDQEDPNFERFKLSDEEYAKKSGTLKEFLSKNKLAHYDSEIKELKEKQAKEKLEKEKQLIDEMKIGSRCQVTAAGAPTRLGTVMYLGPIGDKPGYFVGVKYDEPLGKNDGSVDGKRYFECLPKYGGFVKPDCVTCGDFPEENLDEF